MVEKTSQQLLFKFSAKRWKDKIASTSHLKDTDIPLPPGIHAFVDEALRTFKNRGASFTFT